jgi:hypothetical protein
VSWRVVIWIVCVLRPEDVLDFTYNRVDAVQDESQEDFLHDGTLGVVTDFDEGHPEQGNSENWLSNSTGTAHQQAFRDELGPAAGIDVLRFAVFLADPSRVVQDAIHDTCARDVVASEEDEQPQQWMEHHPVQSRVDQVDDADQDQ